MQTWSYVTYLVIDLHFDVGLAAVQGVLRGIVELDMGRIPAHLNLDRTSNRDVTWLGCEHGVDAFVRFSQQQSQGIVDDCLTHELN